MRSWGSVGLVTQEYELLQPSCGLKKNLNLFCLERRRRDLNLENIIIISSVIFPLLIMAIFIRGEHCLVIILTFI